MRKTRDLTEGRVLTSLIRFAMPVFAALFLQSLYGGVDLLVVGQFSHTADVSGVSTGSVLMQTVAMVVTGLDYGNHHLCGAEDRRGAARGGGPGHRDGYSALYGAGDSPYGTSGRRGRNTGPSAPRARGGL